MRITCLVRVAAIFISSVLFSAMCIKGQEASPRNLDPQCEAFLSALATQNAPGWESMSARDARQVFASLESLFGKGPEGVIHEDRKLENRIPFRIYKPIGKQSVEELLPAIVYFHGGGWVLGDIETHDALCRRLSSLADCAVVSVGYRLAPEYCFPTPLQDCYDATCYVATHASELGMDATQIIVAGDSAGGNLAAAVAMRARDEAGPKLLAQLLIYPALDASCSSESYRLFAEGYGLTKFNMEWFWAQYLGGAPVTALASLSEARSLEGLPHTIIVTAEFDVLRDEAEAYAARLVDAGVSVEKHRFDGMIHGFVHFAGAFDRGLQATSDIAVQLKQIFKHQIKE